MDWYLDIPQLGDSPARREELPQGTTIGRTEASDIQVNDPRVSSRHVRIEMHGGRLALTDLGSQNGTRVDGGPRLEKGIWVPLEDGMTLTLGRVTLGVAGVAPVRLDDLTLPVGGGLDQTVDRSDFARHRPAPAPPPAPTTAAAPPPAPAHTPVRSLLPDGGDYERLQVSRQVSDPGQGPVDRPMTVSPAQAGHDGGSHEDTRNFQTLKRDDGSPAARVAASHTLESINSRLVLLDQAEPRVVPIRDVEFVIGRGSKSACQIDSGAISYEHARISFPPSSMAFQVEDLESANATTLNRVRLNPNQPQRLEWEGVLEFGPIQAVFRVDQDPRQQSLPPRFDRLVADALVREGRLQSADVRRASKQSARALGDELLLGGHVDPDAWGVAARRVLADASHRGTSSRGPWVILVVLALVGALVWALTSGAFEGLGLGQ